MQQKQLLTEKEIESAESVLSKGDRVEIIPVKDGVKVIRVKREEVREIKQNKAFDIIRRDNGNWEIVGYTDNIDDAEKICRQCNKDLTDYEKRVSSTMYAYRRHSTEIG